MTYWNYKRDLKIRQREENELVSDPELERGTLGQVNPGPTEDDNSINMNMTSTERHRRQLAALPFSKLYSRLVL